MAKNLTKPHCNIGHVLSIMPGTTVIQGDFGALHMIFGGAVVVGLAAWWAYNYIMSRNVPPQGPGPNHFIDQVGEMGNDGAVVVLEHVGETQGLFLMSLFKVGKSFKAVQAVLGHIFVMRFQLFHSCLVFKIMFKTFLFIIIPRWRRRFSARAANFLKIIFMLLFIIYKNNSFYPPIRGRIRAIKAKSIMKLSALFKNSIFYKKSNFKTLDYPFVLASGAVSPNEFGFYCVAACGLAYLVGLGFKKAYDYFRGGSAEPFREGIEEIRDDAIVAEPSSLELAAVVEPSREEISNVAVVVERPIGEFEAAIEAAPREISEISEIPTGEKFSALILKLDLHLSFIEKLVKLFLTIRKNSGEYCQLRLDLLNKLIIIGTNFRKACVADSKEVNWGNFNERVVFLRSIAKKIADMNESDLVKVSADVTIDSLLGVFPEIKILTTTIGNSGEVVPISETASISILDSQLILIEKFVAKLPPGTGTASGWNDDDHWVDSTRLDLLKNLIRVGANVRKACIAGSKEVNWGDFDERVVFLGGLASDIVKADESALVKVSTEASIDSLLDVFPEIKILTEGVKISQASNTGVAVETSVDEAWEILKPGIERISGAGKLHLAPFRFQLERLCLPQPQAIKFFFSTPKSLSISGDIVQKVEGDSAIVESPVVEKIVIAPIEAAPREISEISEIPTGEKFSALILKLDLELGLIENFMGSLLAIENSPGKYCQLRLDLLNKLIIVGTNFRKACIADSKEVNWGDFDERVVFLCKFAKKIMDMNESDLVKVSAETSIDSLLDVFPEIEFLTIIKGSGKVFWASESNSISILDSQLILFNEALKESTLPSGTTSILSDECRMRLNLLKNLIKVVANVRKACIAGNKEISWGELDERVFHLGDLAEAAVKAEATDLVCLDEIITNILKATYFTTEEELFAAKIAFEKLEVIKNSIKKIKAAQSSIEKFEGESVAIGFFSVKKIEAAKIATERITIERIAIENFSTELCSISHVSVVEDISENFFDDVLKSLGF